MIIDSNSVVSIRKLLEDTFNNNPDFKFVEDTHTYTLGDITLTSVTTFISKFYEPFDTEYWSERKAYELGKTKEEILQEWEETNKRSTTIGHGTHIYIENYFNKIWQPIPMDVDIFDRVMKFHKIYYDQLHKMQPLVFEQRMFHKRWRLAGTIDSLFIYKNKIYMVDWKTNKKMSTDSDKKFRKLYYPFDEFYENLHNEYSIQLSLYACILKDILGIDIEAMYLCYIPSSEPARMLKCKDMRSILFNYLESDEYLNSFVIDDQTQEDN